MLLISRFVYLVQCELDVNFIYYYSVGTPHEFINGPFKVLQFSDILTNHSTAYSNQSHENTNQADRIKGDGLGPVKDSLFPQTHGWILPRLLTVQADE